MSYDIRNETIEIDAYIPHPSNYNRHPDEQIARLSMSLEMFGQPESVTVWDHPHTDVDGNERQGYFIAGHGVREAAHQLRWSHLRADVLPADYPEELALAYIPAANRLAQLSDPDEIALARLLDAAKAHDQQLLEAIGYNEEEFREVMTEAEAGLGVGGEAPDVEFKEFDESIADDVEFITCPHCRKEFPK